VTPILPRFSATLLEAKAERILTRYQLGLREVFHGPEKVRELIASRSLPPGFADPLFGCLCECGAVDGGASRIDRQTRFNPYRYASTNGCRIRCLQQSIGHTAGNKLTPACAAMSTFISEIEWLRCNPHGFSR